MDSKVPYALLGISPDASVSEIRQAYRRLALKWHPDRQRKDDDRQHAQNLFAEITAAYHNLLRDLELPLTSAVASKLQTRLPTPIQSYRSLSEDSQTNTSNSDCHFFTPYVSNREGSQATLPSSFNGSLKDTHSRHEQGEYMHTSVPMVHSYVSTEAVDYGFPREHWKPTKRPVHSALPPSSSPFAVRQTDGTSYARGQRVNLLPLATYTNRHANQSPELLKRGPPLELLGTGGSGEWTYSLTLSLEELFSGKHCQFCIVRRLLSGHLMDVIMEIDVPRGCRTGTRIICRGVGHELPDGTLQDVAFVINEADHPRFSRIEDDLFLDIKLPWSDHLMQHPGKVNIVGIDGQDIIFAVDYMPRRMMNGDFSVWGAGMPIRDRHRVIGRGDLIIRWEIQSPQTGIRHFFDRFLHSRIMFR